MVFEGKWDFTHKHDVRTCVDAFFRKFPCPAIPQIERAVVTSDEWNDAHTVRTRQREIFTPNLAPKWMHTFFASASVVYDETSQWNEADETLTIQSQNRTFSSFIGTRARLCRHFFRPVHIRLRCQPSPFPSFPHTQPHFSRR
jgi:hypothetical protein